MSKEKKMAAAAAKAEAEAAREGMTSGSAPKKTRWVWQCKVCGYIQEGYEDGLPESYQCPVCGAGPKKFKRVEIEVDA